MLQSIPEDIDVHIFDEDPTEFKRQHLQQSKLLSSSSSGVLGNAIILPRFSRSVSSLCETSQGTLRRINKERLQRGLKAFQESEYLAMLATKHARTMAKLNKVFHSVSSTNELMLVLHSGMVAENIQRGDDLMQMHEETMMGCSVNKMNILSDILTEYGDAIVIGNDGKIYLCQLFRG
jgi:uncharacterized protein YkwD